MKKIVLLLCMVVTTMSAFSHNANDSITHIRPQTCNHVNYQLFPTQDDWVFLKLDTRNGKMWIEDFPHNFKKVVETVLNRVPLVDKSEEQKGRFTLYTVDATWALILLDQIDGRMWYVRWSKNDNKKEFVLISQPTD